MSVLESIKQIFYRNEDNERQDYTERTSVISVPCDLIRPNRAQPRADFNKDRLAVLAESIRKFGILQPLCVRKADIDDIYDYELISGERRLRAARIAGLFTVPCIVLDVGDKTAAEISLTDDITHQPLNMFERAYGLRALSEDHGLSPEEISRRLSVGASSVRNDMQLLELDHSEQMAALALSLSERQARSLLKLEDPNDRMSVMYRIADREMGIRETLAYIDRTNHRETTLQIDEDVISSADRSTAAALRAVQKRIEALRDGGRGVTLEIYERNGSIELHASISK